MSADQPASPATDPNTVTPKKEGPLIRLKDLPLGMKLLTIGGYLSVFGLLVFFILIELFGSGLSTVSYVNTITIDNVKVDAQLETPLFVLILSSLFFIAGWAYLLTGASMAKKRIFFPVLILLAVQLFIVVPTTDLVLIVALLEVGFFAGVVVIYLITQKTRFWRDFPIVHFLIWLGAIAFFTFMSIGLAPTNAEIAKDFSIDFGFLIIVTLVFWVILGLDIVLLGVNTGRWFTTKVFRYLPLPLITALTAFVLLVRPVLALLMSTWLNDGFWLLDLIFSIPLILWAAIVSITKRWTPRNAASLLSLSLASPIVVLGISLAFAGTDPLEAILNLTGLFSPSFLFVSLTAYNVFSSGTQLTQTDGKVAPRKARILLYFGVLILVITFMLFLSNERFVETGEVVGTMQTVIDGVFAMSALFIGVPYIIWMVIKKREAIIGDEDNLNKTPEWAIFKHIPVYGIVIFSIGIALLVSCCLGLLLLL